MIFAGHYDLVYSSMIHKDPLIVMIGRMLTLVFVT